MTGLFRRPADRLAGAAPGWLRETVRPARARPQWGAMSRVFLAVTTPLVAGWAFGHITLGLLPAMGAMAASLSDRGVSSYRARTFRVVSAGAGGACGYMAGHAARGLGWWTVLVLAAVSVVSALVSTGGASGSLSGLQFMVMTVLGIGVPYPQSAGAGALAYLSGALWALLLVLAGWPLRPRAAEEAAAAQAYRALGGLFGVDPAERPRALGAFDTALKAAYDTVFGARSAAAGPDAERTRLIALLNQASQIRGALSSLTLEDREPPPEVAAAVRSLADALAGGGRPGPPPSFPGGSPALRALCSAVEGAAELVSGGEVAEEQLPYERVGYADRLRTTWEGVRYGHLARVYTLRLTLCMAAAAAFSELHWIERSYWVMLTVALVLKPDFGSVFARAVQRGLGTVAGAVIGTLVLLVVPYGPAILVPIAVFAALLPYGQQRNWGLMSTFQVPLVVLLVDLLTGAGPRLAEVRLVDSLIGCAIVLLLGYLPWPGSWQAPVGPGFADAVSATARYLRYGFDRDDPGRALARRKAFDALADLRLVFQRAVTEPAVISGRVTTWLPAMTALERVADATAATVARADHGAPPPTDAAVRSVVESLDDIAAGVREGRPLRARPGADGEESLDRVACAVRGLRDTLSERASP
ncbi:FUSC family protein [Sphaerisporangium corydalis]|uniref:FUSC family protein n=1 Tax=Sphaerisporangium corydalis TaxID=1441875 RepID=A0ABV9EG95_9ACTN|nr:FUSC family protein [Sphaerisporangium corydalis]